jgi:YVTN family beta-propeller protein
MTVAIGPGSTFAGYRIEALIGRGGMGVVFKATDLSLERPVALKLIAPELAEDERFRTRFLNEPRVAASLDHPNVVPIYEAGEYDGQLYLAMRYVEGSDLRSVLRQEGTLSVARTIRTLGQVAGALDAAHRRGLVHRDVKPANVLLDENEHPYLSDFGITMEAGGAPVDSGQTVGTLDYMSPEQIRGEPVDGRSDSYALACILYECLAGEPPFRRQSEAETLWAHMRDEPAPLRGHPALDPVLHNGLAKDKDQRHGTCAELIEAAAGALGVAAPASGRPPLAPALIGRRRAILAAGALVLIGALAAAMVALLTGERADPEKADNRLVAIDAATNGVVEQIPVGATPTDVTVGGGAVWSLSGDDKTLSRVDLANGTVRTLSAGPEPMEIAFAGGSLWAAQEETAVKKQAFWDAYPSPGAVTRLDPLSGVEQSTTRVPIPDKFTDHMPLGNLVAEGGGAVWAIGRPGWVHRIDARTGRVTTNRSLVAWRIASGEGQLWISDSRQTLIRLDPRTGRALRRIPLRLDYASSIAVGENAVWVADPGGRVLRVEQDRARPRAIKVPPGVDSIAAGAGAVWAANSKRGTVARIDPETNSVSARIKVGDTPRALTTDGRRVWIAVSGSEVGEPAAGLRADSDVTALTVPPCGRVLTGGRRDADLLIASDMPLRGQLPVTLPMSQAIAFTVRQNDFRAGRFRLGLQSCDDGVGQYGIYDTAKCRDNARAYARNPAVVGVIGPLNSDCAAEMLPILNRAPGGPVALVAPTNTVPELVRPVRVGKKVIDDTRELYPTGQGGYARVLPSDDYQFAAGAVLAKRLGRGSVFYIESTSAADTPEREWFRATANRIGLRISGAGTYRPTARSYRRLAQRVRASRVSAVYVNSGLSANIGQLLNDLRSVLGTRVEIISNSYLFPIPTLFAEAGQAARGIHITYWGLPVDRLGATGRRFVREFGATQRGRDVAVYDVYAAAATQVLLDAIARSDGTRASVSRALANTRLADSPLGPLALDRRGEPVSNPITVLRAVRGGGDQTEFTSTEGAVTEDVITPPARVLP